MLKKVWRIQEQGPDRIQPDRWRPYGKGFTWENGLIVCDNGTEANQQRGAVQTIELNQTRPAPILAVATSRAEGVSGSPDSGYSLYLDLIYTDGTPLWGQIATFSTGTHDWETRRVLVVPDKPVRSVSVYLLLRHHAGKVWFKDVHLYAPELPQGFQFFDGVPVVVEKVPKQGFEIRDVAAESDFVGLVHRRALGIQVCAREHPGPTGSTLIDVMVANYSNKDRAISLVWAERLPEGHTLWLQDPRHQEEVQPNREYMWTSRFHVGANGRLSKYPFAAVAVDGKGYGLGIDPTAPAFFRVGFHSGTRQLFLVCDLGFTPEKPVAKFRFCRFSFQPDWGFRSALARWYQIFPDQFRVRIHKHGLWMPFAPISKVEGWQDFGFRFKEGTGEVGWDDAHDILTFRYTEPMTWWMSLEPSVPRTLEAALAIVRKQAQGPPNASLTQHAQALLTSGMYDEQGRFACLFLDRPWCNGVVWSMNSMPLIPGPINDFRLKWNDQVRAQWYGPKRKADLDGEYIDSSEGYVTAELDFRRDHFAVAQTPLTFSLDSRRPAIFRGLVAFEYVRAIARDVHRMGKFMMANGTPTRLCWLAPWLDVMGTETDWNPGGHWHPMSHEELLYRRALCGAKPFCFLMNTDFSRFSHQKVERYMQRAVAYGMFPGFFSANAATGHYFTRPELYNRDRPLFRKYIPICKRLSEAGWQPIPLARTDRAEVFVERFGSRYLTLYNEGDQDTTVTLTLQLPSADRIRELLSQTQIPVTQDASGTRRCRLSVPAHGLAVLDLQPER